MLPNIGWGELVIIAGVVLLLFGPKRLPDLASSFGKAVRLFKQGLREGFAEEKPSKEEALTKPTQAS